MIDDPIRSALVARVDSHDPRPDGLDRLLAAADGSDRRPDRRRLYVACAAATVLAAMAVVTLVSIGDDSSQVVSDGSETVATQCEELMARDGGTLDDDQALLLAFVRDRSARLTDPGAGDGATKCLADQMEERFDGVELCLFVCDDGTAVSLRTGSADYSFTSNTDGERTIAVLDTRYGGTPVREEYIVVDGRFVDVQRRAWIPDESTEAQLFLRTFVDALTAEDWSVAGPMLLSDGGAAGTVIDELGERVSDDPEGALADFCAEALCSGGSVNDANRFEPNRLAFVVSFTGADGSTTSKEMGVGSFEGRFYILDLPPRS